MKAEDEVRTLPHHPPRLCPACGTRVAEGAKTCLMCGASLDEIEADTDEEQVAEAAPEGRLKGKQLALLVGLAVVILAASVVIGLNLAQTAPPPSPTATPTVTDTPTPSPIPTNTPTPTRTPTPLPTPTPIPPETYTVQSGDTLLSIAADFGLKVSELKVFNNLATDNIVEGQSLQIPPPTPTPGPTATLDPSQPTPTFAPFVLHTVSVGETLSEIAELYGVSIADIRAANDMPPGAADIQANHVLEIPRYTPTPEMTTEVESVQANAPASVTSRYEAPTLLYPPDGATFTGPTAIVMLQWLSTGILEENVFYRVTLDVSTASGVKTVREYIKSTSWRVPEDLFPDPELESRTCSWYVTVVRQMGTELNPAYTSISEPSQAQDFFWKPTSP